MLGLHFLERSITAVITLIHSFIHLFLSYFVLGVRGKVIKIPLPALRSS